MSKVFLAAAVFFAALATLGPTRAAAQHSRPYNRFEFYGGYTFERANIFPGDEIDTLPFNTTTAPSGVLSPPVITQTPGTPFGTGAGAFHNLHGVEISAAYNVTRFWSAKVDFTARYGQTIHNTTPGGTFLESDNLTQITVAPATNVSESQRDYQILGGVQYKDNATQRSLKPFAHALFGIAPQRLHFANLDLEHIAIIGSPGTLTDENRPTPGQPTISTTSFAMAFGGGLDYHYSRQFDIRILQVDYNPVFPATQTLLKNLQVIDSTITNFTNGNQNLKSLQDLTIPGRRQDNYRISFGIVIHK